MNRYMSELAQMIPACNAVPRKLDKLSILKMAVDHMKNLRGNVIYTNSCHCFMMNYHARTHLTAYCTLGDPHCTSDYKPGFLTDDELKQLVVEVCLVFNLLLFFSFFLSLLQAANGFMMIISCDKACILFVSDTISDVLHEPSVRYSHVIVSHVIVLQENWIGSTLYDLLHPKDIQKVKEQLASFDVEEGTCNMIV